MNLIYRLAIGISLFGLASSACRAEEAKPGKVALEAVNFEDLEKAIAAHKGKVVVLDIWADFCLPCKQRFPHIVEFARTHAQDGLVVITLSVDELDKKKNALAFLQKTQATFQNFILEETDENKEKWEKKLPHTALPILHVFDRNGKLVKTFDTVKTDAIDKYVEEILKAK